MEEEHNIEFEGKLIKRPIRISDIKRDMYNLQLAYNYCNKFEGEMRKVISLALNIACDTLCNRCYELGFDDPEDVETKPLLTMIYKHNK